LGVARAGASAGPVPPLIATTVPTRLWAADVFYLFEIERFFSWLIRLVDFFATAQAAIAADGVLLVKQRGKGGIFIPCRYNEMNI
jgi:hypothetical protein